MKKSSWQLSGLSCLLCSAALLPVNSYAQDDNANEVIEEVITIGTRSQKPRTVADSTVPVDVISAEDFTALGNTADLTDNLKAAVPSYTATPATGDGSAFVRPTSLRGTAPDQTLVLVDGKRRHRSALVQFFAPAAGNGAHGVDIGMIPGIAVKSVEVLRDGAASQYGSDAIAGVINFVPKDASDGGEIQLQYGQFYEGESNFKFGANAGFAVGTEGFINASVEHIDNEGLSRGIQRPDAQALINAGVNGVGQDAVFGDAPLAQSWGRPETKGTRFFINSGFGLANGSELYARLGYADTEGRYRFFYRAGIPATDPTGGHSSLRAIRDAGFTGNLLNTGYTPFLDGDQSDFSFVTGVEGDFSGGTSYDFSFGYGQNELDYFLNNTTNSDHFVDTGTLQRNFDVGGYEQSELNLNADFSRLIRDNLNLAYGAEWREETYTANAGEPNSYFGAGSSGFRGITPESSGEFDRDNFALYADLEHDVSDAWLMQYALRYEDFSDFGDTTNWKIASRYRFSDRFAVRGAASTGFHAPTPGQANVSTIITTFDGNTGLQVEEGLIPATDPAAVSAGGAPLTEEESFNLSIGFTADIGDRTSLTMDYYNIDVDDRIYRTGDIVIADANAPGGERTISFYTNAIDVEHSGVDLVLTSGFDWSANASTDVTFAYGYNKIEVTDQKLIPSIQSDGSTMLVAPVSSNTVEDIENNYPENRFVLSTNTQFGDDWNLMLRANYYGEHYDERGTIAGSDNDNDGIIDQGSQSKNIGSTVYFDAELGYDFNDNWRFAFGGSNIFDEYVDEIPSGTVLANRQSVGLQYPRRSAANYEGGSWYLKATYRY